MVGVIAGAALAAPCANEGDADASFGERAEGGRVHVVVEVWPGSSDPAWADGILSVLDRHAIHAVVVMPPGPPAPERLPLLARVALGPHDLGVVLPEALVPTDPTAAPREVNRAVRPLEKAGEPVKTVVTRVGTRTTEALLGSAGFRSLVDLHGLPDATPRMAGHFEGQQRIDVVLPPGPYEDDPDPRCAPFLPVNADRVARAIDRASGAPGTPIVRLALTGLGAGPDDAAVLDRWLVEIGVPSGATFGTAEEARAAVLDGFRRPETAAPPANAGGRVVDPAGARAAAEALRTADPLPRALPGALNLTEAFAAFAELLADPLAPTLRLPPLSGPAQTSASSLTGEVPVDREALVAFARSVAATPPTELPSAVRIGAHLLTAREVLVALASAARGDDPVTTRPVTDPDPNARGLGWGRSEAP